MKVNYKNSTQRRQFLYYHLIATFDIELECGIKIHADSSDFF